jgi:hypothetical protein
MKPKRSLGGSDFWGQDTYRIVEEMMMCGSLIVKQVPLEIWEDLKLVYAPLQDFA